VVFPKEIGLSHRTNKKQRDAWKGSGDQISNSPREVERLRASGGLKRSRPSPFCGAHSMAAWGREDRESNCGWAGATLASGRERSYSTHAMGSTGGALPKTPHREGLLGTVLEYVMTEFSIAMGTRIEQCRCKNGVWDISSSVPGGPLANSGTVPEQSRYAITCHIMDPSEASWLAGSD
jgi:hypothetical protein